MRTLFLISLSFFIVGCKNSDISSFSFKYDRYDFLVWGVKKITFENTPNGITYALEDVDENQVPQIEYIKINYKRLKGKSIPYGYNPFQGIYIKLRGQSLIRYEGAVGMSSTSPLYPTAWFAEENRAIIMKGCSTVAESLYDFGIKDFLISLKIHNQIRQELFDEYPIIGGQYYIYYKDNWYIYRLRY